MRYEITEENVVLVFREPQIEPVLSQPYDPAGDGSPFKTKAAATKWATDFIAMAEAQEPVPTES